MIWLRSASIPWNSGLSSDCRLYPVQTVQTVKTGDFYIGTHLLDRQQQLGFHLRTTKLSFKRRELRNDSFRLKCSVSVQVDQTQNFEVNFGMTPIFWRSKVFNCISETLVDIPGNQYFVHFILFHFILEPCHIFVISEDVW